MGGHVLAVALGVAALLVGLQGWVLQFTSADRNTFGIGKNPIKIWPT